MEKSILLNEREVYDYLEELLESLKQQRLNCDYDVYHHNTGYEYMTSIITHGIQPLIGLNEFGIKHYTPEQLVIFNDVTSHINGSDGISLSKVDSEGAYPDEDIYNPYDSEFVDIIINGIKSYRITTHYFNEFIHEGAIMPDKFLAFDIRILRLIENAKNKEDFKKINTILRYVESLREMVMSMQKNGLYIPIREMSCEDSHESGPSLNQDKIMEMPKVIIKK
jgi:hypothetical protein